MKMLVAQWCPTFCDPMDYSPPGSSVCGILQARMLEWVAIFYSRGSPNPESEPTSLTSLALADRFFLPPVPPGKPGFSPHLFPSKP